ncbi:MAG: hypothetical protein HYS08_03935 [Chlamydiae bacterium]|nr:hypothetical protein [Chlamydiota bacterium]MBI3266809.1 hypothetical protein [Chlamydiota bacterium]
MTRDVDIVIQLKSRDVERVVDLFKDEFYIDEGMISHAIAEKGIFNMIDFVKDLDKVYLEKWIQSLGLQSIYKKVNT